MTLSDDDESGKSIRSFELYEITCFYSTLNNNDNFDGRQEDLEYQSKGHMIATEHEGYEFIVRCPVEDTLMPDAEYDIMLALGPYLSNQI